MNNNTDKYTSSKIRYLDYISQFTTDIQYVKGKNNTIADTLLQTHLYVLDIDVLRIRFLFISYQILNNMLADTSLNLQKFPAPLSNRTLFCDVKFSLFKPHVLPSLRLAFEHLHGLSHPVNKPQSSWLQNVLCDLI